MNNVFGGVGKVFGTGPQPHPLVPETTQTGLMPVVTASASVLSKVATKASRDFSANPLNVHLLFDSNGESGDVTQNSKSYRERIAVKFQQFINDPIFGFNTNKNPFHSQYFGLGTLTTMRLHDAPEFQRTRNSSNWMANPGAYGEYCGASSTFVLDASSAGYLSWHMDRRDQMTTSPVQIEGDRLFTQMKVIGSAGNAPGGGFGLGSNTPGYNMADFTSTSSLVNANHGDLTVEFRDGVGGSVISSTSIDRTTTGIGWYWDGYTSPFITLPALGSYPNLEIRIYNTSLNERSLVSGLYFDDGSPKVRVIDGATAGLNSQHIAANGVDASGTIGTKDDQNSDSFGANIGFAYETPCAVRGVTLTGGVSHNPIFTNGPDYVVIDVMANSTNQWNHLRFQGYLQTAITEIVARQSNAVIVLVVPPPRGRGNVSALDTYISSTISIDSRTDVSWGGMVQALYNLQTANSGNVVVMDWNLAFNRLLGVTQATATQLSSAFSLFNGNDANHHDPWMNSHIAMALSMFMSNRLATL